MRTVFSWYFAANDVNLKILNRGKQVLSYRLPSFGTFSTALDPIYSFGIPRQVEMSGIMVDVDAVVNSLWGRNNDANLAKTFGQQLGLIASALEHRIPELFFTSVEYPGEAVSAVKALALASAQGQRIYQITSENVGVVNSLNISAEVKNEIRNSVAVGKVVTVSQSNITVGGWTGIGYIVIDPETGAGAYRISGGGNGGLLIDAIGEAMAYFLLAIVASYLLLPFLLIYSPIMVISGFAVATNFLAWMVVRTHLPSDSAWRTFLVDMFGGLWVGILGAMFTGLTLGVMLVAIALLIIYAVLDTFLPSMAFLLLITRRNGYA